MSTDPRIDWYEQCVSDALAMLKEGRVNEAATLLSTPAPPPSPEPPGPPAPPIGSWLEWFIVLEKILVDLAVVLGNLSGNHPALTRELHRLTTHFNSHPEIQA